MDTEAVINELKKKYPEKNIIKLPENKPTEIICEVEPTSKHPSYSVAIAVISSTAAHYNDETETYEVLRGKLNLKLGKKEIELHAGDNQVIKPGIIHSAKSNQAWVKVTTKPGWTHSGHHLVRT